MRLSGLRAVVILLIATGVSSIIVPPYRADGNDENRVGEQGKRKQISSWMSDNELFRSS